MISKKWLKLNIRSGYLNSILYQPQDNTFNMYLEYDVYHMKTQYNDIILGDIRRYYLISNYH